MAVIAVTGRPAVSAILVNWNGAHHLRSCLPSLLSQSITSLEMIVVDNGSKDDSVEVAREFGARWLPLGKNLGLGPGLNRGAAEAAGDFLLFINNDMRFDPGFVAALLEPMQENKEIFATDGMQFNWDGSERGHLATRLVRKKPTRRRSSTELVPGLYFYAEEGNQQTPVFTASAACMLARKELFQKLRGFDNRLPLGYEDVEICWRAWIRGWKTVYVPNAICWHKVGSSGHSEEGMLMNFRGILRGRLVLASKLLPPKYALRTWLVSTLGLAKDIGTLRWKFAIDRTETLVAVAGMLPELLREKAKLFSESGSTPAQHLEMLLRLSDQDSGADRGAS